MIAWLAASALPASAQEEFELSWFTLDGGGGPGADDFFAVHATLGQPDAGILGDDFFALEGGFWVAALAAGPSLTRQPESVTVSRGDPVTFNIVASGNLPLRYQWRLNGVNLAGATNATLAIPGAQLTNGGTYTVVVFNDRGSVVSQPATLSFNLPRTAPGNNFVNRVSINSTNLIFTGDNTNATSEAGEPRHAGQPGGRSVWYTWTAPDSGIATFHTTGSTFDTLLAVYLGTDVNALTPVAGNDDARGRYLASEVRFNAVKATPYQIVIDGVGGEEGAFVLSWELEVTNHVLPVITLQPASRAVPLGASTTFTVMATGNGLTYHWFFNQQPVAGANSASLTITNVMAGSLGSYSVGVTNDLNRGVESLEVALELGDLSSVVSFAKLAEAIAAAEGGAGGGGPQAFRPAAALGTPAGFASVSVGGIGGQTFGNSNAISQDNCHKCRIGVGGGAARWFVLATTGDGILTVDTIGSSFDTLLYVYRYSGAAGFDPCPHFVGCDNNGAADGTSSLLSFATSAGARYLLGVDGVRGAKGTIRLNWKLCLAPSPFLDAGGQFMLTTPANPVPYPDEPGYFWRRNDELLGWTGVPAITLAAPPANTARFSVDYVSVPDGAYKHVTNALGSFVTMNVAMARADRLFQIVLPNVTTPQFRMEAAVPALTNCDGRWLWLPVTNYVVATQETSLVLTFPLESTNRLIRIRPPPPVP